ncbi:PEP-CTERM sorting domain-containing protein [Crocosphaera sp. Alani8]
MSPRQAAKPSVSTPEPTNIFGLFLLGGTSLLISKRERKS